MLFMGDDVKKLQSLRQFESQNSVTLMITDRTGLHSVLLQLIINMHLEFFGVGSDEKRLTCKP